MKREIIITEDGSSTIHLPEWDEQYHSKHGAIQEAYHVFIKSGLHHICHSEHHEASNISILEIGFGTGLNTFITLLEAEKLNVNIDYVGVEGYHVAPDEISQLKRVPIKDMTVAYDCPYQHKMFLLVFNNALHVPSMSHNLISPFIMEEAGLEVDSKTKIHNAEVGIEGHSFYGLETDLRVLFKMRSIFSYFETGSLTADNIENCQTYNTLYLCPNASIWNPSRKS